MKIRLAFLALATTVLPAAATEAHFGLFGITALETARLSALCDGSVTPAPCEITFEFHHISGRVLKQATVTVQPGARGFLELPGIQVAGAGSPVHIDPCWKITRGTAQATFEIFDAVAQRTRSLINWGDRPAPGRGDVDFGLAGITPFDTARLSAFCDGDGSVTPQPCDIVFEFHDLQGRTTKQSRMTLQPEAGGFLDLKWSEVAAAGRRVEMEPCIKVEGGTAVGSFAVIDTLSGLTIAHAYAAALVQ